MDNLKLEKSELGDKESALSMLEEIRKVDAGFPWQYSGLADLHKASSYEKWLEEKVDASKGINLHEGYVPATIFFLKRESDGKVCGAIDIRHYLNDFLLEFGGHIGYSITPSERGKGYGKLQLKLGLIEAKKLGIEKCLITADEKNIASNKTIISQGGKLENTIMWEEEPLNRYWINLK